MEEVTDLSQNRQRDHGDDVYEDKNLFFKKEIDIQHALIGTLLATHDVKYMSKIT
jgi:hypothetical protein